jgi:hypothetical protein
MAMGGGVQCTGGLALVDNGTQAIAFAALMAAQRTTVGEKMKLGGRQWGEDAITNHQRERQ